MQFLLDLSTDLSLLLFYLLYEVLFVGSLLALMKISSPEFKCHKFTPEMPQIYT